MKIYLDIDGVLLDNKYNQMPYLKEFLTTIFNISNNNVYWLSVHSKHGTNEIVLEHLKDILDKDIFNMIKDIKCTKWNILKTEGIDTNDDFLWFDDNVFDKEYTYLESIGKENCLIKVKNNLKELVELL